MVIAARLPRRVNNECQDKRLEIEIEIENDLLKGVAPQWIIGSFETPIKTTCMTPLTFDQTFCTKVCELTVGDECTPGIQTPGDDLCGMNLECRPDGHSHTCQEIPEFDSSYSSDYIYKWLNNPLTVPDVDYSLDDYLY